MTARSIILSLALLSMGVWPGGGGTVRVTVHLIGCSECRSRSPGVSVWDKAQDAEIAPQVSGRNADGFVLALPPGYYRVFLRGKVCNADPFLGLLPHRDRRFDVTMRCRPSIRLVDGMRGLAGDVPSSVRSISMWPADGSQRPIAATISRGAYYFDEANCDECVLNLQLNNGKTARVGVDLNRAKNFTLLRSNLSEAAVQDGISVRGSPFNAPETLVEGPAISIWVLDRLGNRVAVIRPGIGCREYDLPTPFSDAGQIIGTSRYVWVSERNGGRIVRIASDGKMTEYAIGGVNFHRNLRMAPGSDGRVWFVDQDRIGAIDESGKVTRYALGGPVFWLRDLALGADGRIWMVGLADSYADGTPFVAAIDAAGRSQRFSLSFDAAAILAARGGLWVSGDYDSLSFVDLHGREKTVGLPVARMWPKPYAVGASDELWFTGKYGNLIARATPDGTARATATEFGPAGISDMRVGPRGDLWIAEPKAHGIEQYGKGFEIAPKGVAPTHLFFDSNGNLWYSDPQADVVGTIAIGRRGSCYAFRLSHVRSCAFSRIDIVAQPVF